MAGLTKIIKGALGVLSKSGATVSTFNRTTSDGDIIELQKDGTAVGSIGSAGSGGDLYISSSAGAGIYFGGGSGSGSVAPTTDGSTRVDNVVDLGNSSFRWNDLWMGGNIYLGGTGSANALDDYEEGTWTPVYGGGGSSPTITYGLQSGTYTKIGRIVIVVCNIRGQATAQGSDYLRIEGLPFPAKSSPSAYSGIGVAGYSINWNADNAPTRGLVSAGLSFITLRTFSTDDPRDELAVTVDAGNLATSSTGDNSVQVTVTYETN